MLTRPFTRLRSVWRDYPQQFWLLLFTAFINSLGGALLWPFYTLYVTQRFHVGLAEAGVVIALWGSTELIGGLIGGAVADRFGRKNVMILSLIVSAAANVGTGLADQLGYIYLMAIVAGLFGSIGHPAMQAMVADLLPEAKRAEGYGMLRVMFNLSVVLGPTFGGILATQSYLYLFVSDAIASSIVAVIVARAIKETHHVTAQLKQAHESFAMTLRGYGTVLRDRPFIAFILITIIANMMYFQMNSTLPVFLRDIHGVPAQGYGYILSLNALIVVIFQLWVSRRVRSVPPLVLLTIGAALYGVGLGMYGFVGSYALFVAAIVVITLGEMLFVPTTQSYSAQLAPEDMRGRYMALYGFTFGIPGSFGTILAGLIAQQWGAYSIWHFAALGSFVAALGYASMYLISRPAPQTTVQAKTA